MRKPSAKDRKGTPTLPSRKSSQNPVDTSIGKTISTTQGVAIRKKSTIMCSWSLSTNNQVSKTIKTCSSSVKSVAATSEVGSKSGDGEALIAGGISHCRKVSKSKVVGYKSLGSTPRFPPPISKEMGGGGRLIQQQDAPSENQPISHSRIAQLPFIYWAALALGTVVKLLQKLFSKSMLGYGH